MYICLLSNTLDQLLVLFLFLAVMEEIVSPLRLHSNRLKSSTSFELLLVSLVTAFFVWYVQFLWKRRKWYRCASTLPGPFALPLIGSALYFMGGPYGKTV